MPSFPEISCQSAGGLCGDVNTASDVTGGRIAALLSSHRYVRAARRVCLAEYCSRVGITAGGGASSDLAAAIRPPPELLQRCVGSPRLSLSRRKRRNSPPFTRGRLVFPAGAFCASAVPCREGWSSGGQPASDSHRGRHRSKRLGCAARMGET